MLATGPCEPGHKLYNNLYRITLAVIFLDYAPVLGLPNRQQIRAAMGWIYPKIASVMGRSVKTVDSAPGMWAC